MNALNRFAEIADLVNSWADRLQKDDDGRWPERWQQSDVCDEMRAFSNGLRGTVELFRPIVTAAEEVVAEHNVALSKLQTNSSYGKRDFNCRRYSIEHDAHPWTLDEIVYYCAGEGFTAQRTRHGDSYCLNPNHPDGCKYPGQD